MGAISILYRNILESATVTATTEDSDYPKWRLHDRDVGKLYKGTSTASHTIQVDQGEVATYDVDTLIIPDGHNLLGATLYWQHSPAGSSWTEMVDFWAGATGLIIKEATGSQDKRFWRFICSSPIAIPEMPELWMGEQMELADVVAWGYEDGPRGNVERVEALSGRPHFLTLGEDREYRRYLLKMYDSGTKDAVEAFLGHARSKPFWLKDLDDTWLYMSLVDPNVGPQARPSLNRYDLTLEMLEVLA